ncbi:LysR family transcriptional regulator ArgP [Litoribacillus peritrichatus]|uniref:ArgP/LysG family DNA-binding transcriptional regulator n=1 Tax=Litoribacillus peritrichatus TaxID=718191 RepID=A0ABP7MYF9_9GAMM
MNFDQKQLATLAAIIEEESFDAAATKLFITQSAVSQRLRQLESSVGQTLIIRSSPPKLTDAGHAVLRFYQQTTLLQKELLNSLNQNADFDRQTLSIGVNADSLATWLFDALKPLLDSNKLLIDIKVDDQDNTRELLTKGEVIGCITSDSAPIQGCNSFSLGVMRYRCLVSPDFKHQFFKDGVTQQAMLEAPAVQFNNKDELQSLYMKTLFQDRNIGLRHRIPSTESYLEFIRRGYAWGMVPDVQSQPLLTTQQVTELIPGQYLDIPLYWHIWNLKTELNKELTDRIIHHAHSVLN